jgi:hypothetical protein
MAFGLSAGLDSVVSKKIAVTPLLDTATAGVGLATAVSLITLLLSLFTSVAMLFIVIPK